MEFRVLGPVEIGDGDQRLAAGSPLQRSVLAVLLLDVGRLTPIDRLIDHVWGDDPPASVRNVLYGHITRLRAVLAAGADEDVTLVRRQGGYVLTARRDQVDLYRFRDLVNDATAAAGNDARAVYLLREALSLWRGSAVAGLNSPWFNALREALEFERRTAVLELNDARLRLGQHAILVSELSAQTSAAPPDERLVGQLMLALYRSGRQGEALRTFDRTRRYLADELGADPGPELRTLNQQILQASPELALPATAHLMRAAPVPRQLPPDVAGFTGRAAELAVLDGLLLDPTGTGTATVISAVAGTAGVGKTALAVHWAHRVAGEFPDGQLHANLRGYDVAGAVSAADALSGFLRALGVPGQDIPAEEAERAALFRSLLAGMRVLVVLDNASTVDQVRPLLPGHPGCRVVVTSRDSLAGLVARDGARRLDLELLPLSDAVTLLRELIGDRADAEPSAVTDLASQCARLPLALRIAAELAAARPGRKLADLVTELADEQRRLDLLHADGDPRTTIRSVFSWSYDHLDNRPARTFRLAGLHPGPDFGSHAIAALTASSLDSTHRDLEILTRAHLLQRLAPDRYSMHDLLRAYAAEQASAHDDQDERESAIGRALDHYLHTAAEAAHILVPEAEPMALAPPRRGVAAARLTGHSQALAWFDANHRVLIAAVSLAAGSGFDAHAWQLSRAIEIFLRLRGHWQDRVATQGVALAAAKRCGDTAAQAVSSHLLANAYSQLGDHDQAHRNFVASLVLYEQLGNRLGEARIHQDIGVLASNQGRYSEALEHSERALRLYQAIGDKAGEADALNNIGWYHGLLGDYRQARAFCHQALTVCDEVGINGIDGEAWDSLGYAEHHLGNLSEAAACYQRALTVFRETGALFKEAGTLSNLGDTHHAAGELALAQEAWQHALTIFDDIQHADAAKVRAKLASKQDHDTCNPSAQGSSTGVCEHPDKITKVEASAQGESVL